ncbi:hypothetical protein VAMP_222n70 [Candidatus Vampirococcus lugosii]|uniref:Uncharacterized protein n=1 Tax=Candidatus Vampirococcus lugosii TaxID=2789015 RepID=A0ABS5QM19_9BACT|nr:hypothetical protein [Candidatus Vampirococcus lugosii]MBS8122252.1 hypothetical protein [Candidatus Vampirococcus lugosii]
MYKQKNIIKYYFFINLNTGKEINNAYVLETALVFNDNLEAVFTCMKSGKKY